MRKLSLVENQTVLLDHLEVASNLWTRTKGLLGRAHLAPNEGLLILRCNSIHTFFMKFAIDLVFLDRKMTVRKVIQAVGPGRIVLPVWRATSVIELSAGFLEKHPLKVGDKLNVDPALS